ncbi:uncharacterized protein LOC120310788 isoform X2 [Crotalus tigris]|uniref:uncharacterized protein LOC120310788 isoform X2 n=1 Tax=Crotalus tigris TaxID=88082 RepID=UPI00192F2F10|nr:uncharacterized protein LOC120310788 isoform X2 [Crotalus tigris]
MGMYWVFLKNLLDFNVVLCSYSTHTQPPSLFVSLFFHYTIFLTVALAASRNRSEASPAYSRGEKIPPGPIAEQRNCRQPKKIRLGIILDRVKGAPPGNGAIRLTGYHQKTGQVICTSNSGFNYCTNFIRSDIKHSYFLFGEEQVIFWDVLPQEDMILVARFYHCPNEREASAFWDNKFTSHYPSLGSEQWLTAWAVFRLTKRFESCEVMFAGAKREKESRMTTWNIGTHTSSLYQSPVPSITVLPTVPEHKRYGDATLRLHIFSTQKPELPFPPESPAKVDPTEA